MDPQAMLPRPLLVILSLLNALVLLGQIWPAGAPPFARGVNLLFLGGSLCAYLYLLRKRPALEGIRTKNEV